MGGVGGGSGRWLTACSDEEDAIEPGQPVPGFRGNLWSDLADRIGGLISQEEGVFVGRIGQIEWCFLHTRFLGCAHCLSPISSIFCVSTVLTVPNRPEGLGRFDLVFSRP